LKLLALASLQSESVYAVFTAFGNSHTQENRGLSPIISVIGVLSQPIQIAKIVLIDKEARLAVIATLDEVNGHIWQCDAGTARHGEPSFYCDGCSLAEIIKPWSVPYYSGTMNAV